MTSAQINRTGRIAFQLIAMVEKPSDKLIEAAITYATTAVVNIEYIASDGQASARSESGDRAAVRSMVDQYLSWGVIHAKPRDETTVRAVTDQYLASVR
jgi:hypothetical protein